MPFRFSGARAVVGEIGGGAARGIGGGAARGIVVGRAPPSAGTGSRGSGTRTGPIAPDCGVPHAAIRIARLICATGGQGSGDGRPLRAMGRATTGNDGGVSGRRGGAVVPGPCTMCQIRAQPDDLSPDAGPAPRDRQIRRDDPDLAHRARHNPVRRGQTGHPRPPAGVFPTSGRSCAPTSWPDSAAGRRRSRRAAPSHAKQHETRLSWEHPANGAREGAGTDVRPSGW
jgi:hypothetical protein